MVRVPEDMRVATQRQLADLLGVSQEHLSRQLRRAREEGS